MPGRMDEGTCGARKGEIKLGGENGWRETEASGESKLTARRRLRVTEARRDLERSARLPRGGAILPRCDSRVSERATNRGGAKAYDDAAKDLSMRNVGSRRSGEIVDAG